MGDSGFRDRIAAALKDTGLINPILARTLGVSVETIRKYKKGKGDIKGVLIERLAKIYGYRPDWLLLGIEPMFEPGSDADKIDWLNQQIDEQDKKIVKDLATVGGDNIGSEIVGHFSYVPMAEAHLNAGGGAFVPSERSIELLSFRKDWLRKIASSVKNLVLMMIDGDSMSPTIQAGDIVMIDRGRTRIISGRIFALGVEDMIMIKRLDVLADGMARIISDNRDNYPPYKQRLSDIRILGQVIWFARQLVRPD